MASSRTRTVETMLAMAELMIAGQGLAPGLAPKNSRYPSSVRGAVMLGGLVAAFVSLWNEVSTMKATGRKKNSPITHAAIPMEAVPSREPWIVERRLRTFSPPDAAVRPEGFSSETTMLMALTPLLGTGRTRRAARTWR